MASLFFNQNNFNEFVIDPASAGKGMFHVLEKVLCDGWQSVEIDSADVVDGELKVVAKANLPKEFAWMVLCELSTGNVSIDGEYRCTSVDGKEAKFKPANRTVPNGSASRGSIVVKSAGWEKLYRDERVMVIRPKKTDSRCILFLRDLGKGMMPSWNQPFDLTKDKVPPSNPANYDEFMQMFWLRDYDKTKTHAENYNLYNIQIDQKNYPYSTPQFKQNEGNIPLVCNKSRAYYKQRNFPGHNVWYLVVQPEMVFWGFPTYWYQNSSSFTEMNCFAAGLIKNAMGEVIAYASVMNYTGTSNYFKTHENGDFATISPFSYLNNRVFSNIIQDGSVGLMQYVLNSVPNSKYRFGNGSNEYLGLTPFAIRPAVSLLHTAHGWIPYAEMPFLDIFVPGDGQANLMRFITINNKLHLVLRVSSNEYNNNGDTTFMGIEL